MKLLSRFILAVFVMIFIWEENARAGEVDAGNSKKLNFSGLLQFQHLYDTNIEQDAEETNNGFRVRRARLQASANLNEWISTKLHIEIRDNSPQLLDAEGKLRFFRQYAVRVGQFKVPVWREELRSTGKLFLIERSKMAAFLEEHNLSSRQIGIEFGGKLQQGMEFAVNYSNGSGKGVKETAGSRKADFTNNGKLFTGRFGMPVGNVMQIAVSGAVNQAGYQEMHADSSGNLLINNKGNIFAIIPDFGIYLPFGLDIEGGFAYGRISKNFLKRDEDQDFLLFDVSGRWKSKLAKPRANLAGADAWEIAAGVTYIEPDQNRSKDETMYFRFGPALYFGSQTRLQVNGEIEKPFAEGADTIFALRSQLSIIF